MTRDEEDIDSAIRAEVLRIVYNNLGTDDDDDGPPPSSKSFLGTLKMVCLSL